MKPLSPILFLTAVNAVALRTDDATDAEGCALQFVQEMGTIAHLEGTGCATSWPLAGLRTVEGVLSRAGTMRMLRLRPRAGDIVVLRSHRMGVVAAVLNQEIGPFARCFYCRIATASLDESCTTVVEMEELWCGPGRGDVFIRWYEGQQSLRRAA